MVVKNILSAVLIVLAIILFLGVWSAWGPIALLINALIALAALKLVGWLGVKIKVNIWSLFIVLLAGIPGLLILILLSITGIAFKEK